MRWINGRKLAIAGGIVAAAAAVPVAALALGVGKPQLGDVEASFSLNLTAPPALSTCKSFTGTNFAEEKFAWAGSMTDANPGGHAYPLSGVLSIKGTFTINTVTGEGVGDGFITLTTNTGSLIAQGSFELPTQIIDPQADAVVRGLIDVPLFTNNSPNGSRLIANAEGSFNATTGALTGFMGKSIASPAVPDISMEFNELTCS
jgi:hypothetical protein